MFGGTTGQRISIGTWSRTHPMRTGTLDSICRGPDNSIKPNPLRRFVELSLVFLPLPTCALRVGLIKRQHS